MSNTLIHAIREAIWRKRRSRQRNLETRNPRKSCAALLFSWIPGSQIRVPRLAKEAFGAFEEALVQRGILLTDEGGEFLQLSALLGVQACRHFHHHARK